MYRKFKHGDQASQHHNSVQTNNLEPADLEAKQKVAECWKAILENISAAQTRNAETVKSSAAATASGGWHTVRIFVSSTFIDFFTEREVLVKKVFPELRDWCYERRLQLIECDLRWGVPKDATTTQALVTCLEELDRCFQENGQPFFLNLLGERYGWIPGLEDVPQEVREKYSWVNDTSMTFMEILHGALRTANPNAAYFMRDPDFVPNLPEDHAKRFNSESSLAHEHMRELKCYLQKQFPTQIFPYTAQFKGMNMSTGREQVELTGLDMFADGVKEFFKAAIEKTYPKVDDDINISPQEAEKALQWTFILDKAGSVTGREKEIQMLLDYSHGADVVDLEKIDGKDFTVRLAEDWDRADDDNMLCVVTAEGGWGKTALLAQLTTQAQQEGQEVFYHFVGSTANSGFYSHLVHRLLLALSADPTASELEEALTPDLQKQQELLRKELSGWRESGREMLIVIDGVNELDNSWSVQYLSWLPPTLPRGLRCIVSCNKSHLLTISRLFEHPAYHLPLAALNFAALESIGVQYLGRFGKKLDKTQLQQVVHTTKVDNPLWMMLMAEELRIFGDFRTMDKKIESLPDKMDAFLSSVVHRLVTEDEAGYVKKTLFMMSCSANGLPLSHILRLLGDVESKTECPPLYWAQTRVILKPYTRSIKDGGEREEYVAFVHEAMYKAVQQYLEDSKEDDAKDYHRQIADVYQLWCDNFILCINYLPGHLKSAGLHKRLNEFLRKDPNAMKMAPFVRSRFLTEQRCRGMSDAVMPMTKEMMICQRCYHQRGGFNPAAFTLNKDTCCLCSYGLTPFNRHPARLCTQHAMKNNRGPNFALCCVCSTTIFLTEGEKTKNQFFGPACLCMHCSFGNWGKTCCEFGPLL